MKLKKAAALAATLTMACSVAACGGSPTSSGSTASEMQVMLYPALAYRLPVLIAQERGFFEEAGLSVNVVAQPNNLQGAQALTATKSQAGQVGTATFAQGVQGGSDVQAFCGGITVTQSSIVAAADTDLPAVADGATPEAVFDALSGRKIGAQTPVGSGFQIMLDAALTEGGASDLTWVNIGGSNSVTQASLQNGSIEVAQSNPSGTQALVESGAAKELIYLPDHSELYGELYGSPWIAPTEWLRNNGETARSFCDATATALEFILDPANRDEARQILIRDSGISDPAIADAVLETYGEYSSDISPDAIQRTFDRYTELGITKPEPELDAGELVNTVGR
ncbi:ABC transporter substrate-binding protein [Gordonia sp. NPDC058843]|uniref:ABC transporter substrate-binding protein n=1 Tax=Gordonia sp. NPDC058843 TaxID=3346648 RepID=UPI0036810A09